MEERRVLPVFGRSCSSVTPLVYALTGECARKSFRIRTYRKPGEGASAPRIQPTFMASLELPYNAESVARSPGRSKEEDSMAVTKDPRLENAANITARAPGLHLSGNKEALATLASRGLTANRGIPLNLDWVENIRVNTSAVEWRAQTLVTRRTVKKDWQVAWLLRAITCMDLTTLSGDDTDERVRRLCAKGRQPIRHRRSRSPRAARFAGGPSATSTHNECPAWPDRPGRNAGVLEPHPQPTSLAR